MDFPIFLSIDAILFYILIALIAYFYIDWKFGYWKRKGVPHIAPTSLIYGNIKQDFWSTRNFGLFFQKKLYRPFIDKPFVGYYEFHRPALMIRDIELVKAVLSEKFNCFHDRLSFVSEKNDPLFALNPFTRTGSEWKEVRSLIAQGITTNKLGSNLDLIFKPYGEFCKYIERHSEDLELTGLIKKITCNMVASWGWGIEGDGFSETKSIVYNMFEVNPSLIRSSAMRFNWFLSTVLKSRLFSKEQTNFFHEITRQSIENIKKNKIEAPCLLQFILQAMRNSENQLNESTLTAITSYLVTFYVDAHETTSTVLSYILYDLMIHPDVQLKLRDEVKRLKEEELNLSFVDKLEYLQMVMSESMRLRPIITVLSRVCTERCTLGSIEFEPGTKVTIPTLAIHFDPQFYPDPYKFDPENFNDENKKMRHQFAHLPYGQGPRICLGMKFSTAVMKMLITLILRDYEIIPAKDHVVKPIKQLDRSSFYIPDHTLYVHFRRLEKSC